MDKISTIGGGDIVAQTEIQQQKVSLDKVKSLANRSVSSEAEVEKAAGGFEALLLHQMLKAMWATVDKSGLLGDDSHQGEIYRDMFNQAIADSVAEGRGMGVKQFLKKELLSYTKQTSNK